MSDNSDARKALDALDDVGLAMHQMASHPPSQPITCEGWRVRVYDLSEKLLHIHKTIRRALAQPPKIEGLDEALALCEKYNKARFEAFIEKYKEPPLKIVTKYARQRQAGDEEKS